MSQQPKPRTLQDSIEAEQRRDMQHRGEDPVSGFEQFLAWPGRLAILFVAVVPPWLIGSVHARPKWIISLALLIGLGSWWIETAFARQKRQILPHVLIFVLLGGLLGLAQVTTLPNWFNQYFLGAQTELYQETLGPLQNTPRMADVADSAAFFSIAPEATWKQLQLMLLGIVALCLGCRFFRRTGDTVLLLTLITVNGAALAFFGMIQKLTSNGKIYWQIELSYGGTPFGPFVNRNNSAGYLLLCLAACVGLMLYLWPSNKDHGPGLIVSKEIPFWRQFREHLEILLADLTATKLAVVAAFVLIAAGIISGLSRGGVSAMFAGSFITMMIYGMARKPKAGMLLAVLMFVMVVSLTSWIGFYDQLMQRFGDIESTEDARLQSWAETVVSVGDMGLLGAGLGAYPYVNRLYGLERETHVFEYAENQFVQTLIDAGIPGCMLLIAATIFITYLGLFLLYRGSSSMSIAMGTMGVFLCSTQVIASCFDFGWYIPANTLLLAVLVGVVSQHGHAFAGRLRKNHLFRLQPPIWITNLVCLAAFGLCLLTSFSLFRQAETEDRLLPARQVWDYANMPLDVTEERIELLSSTLATSNHSTQLNELGRLWIHRSRLLFWESMLKLLPSDVGKPENQEKINNQFWSIATLGRMEEQMGDFRMRLGNSFANEFQREEFMANSLLPAVDAFYASLKLRPVQPEIQIQLGQILCLVGDRELAQQTIERAVASAPNNVNIRITASLSNLFLGDLEQAIPHLRRTLELDPAQFVKAISLIQGLTGRISVPVSDKVIADRIIPENPQLVYDYAIKFVPESSPLRSDLLGKADSMLKSVSLSDYKNVLLKANILLAKGDTEQGIEQLEMAVVSNPSDQATQYRLAKLQFENGKLDKALRHAKRLNQMNETNKNYEQLLLEVQKAIDTERLFNRE